MKAVCMLLHFIDILASNIVVFSYFATSPYCYAKFESNMTMQMLLTS